jgi:hypothetical protein
MQVFFVPLVVSYVLLGCGAGGVIGKKLWGKAGGIALGMILGLLPGLMGLGVCCWLLWRSNLLPS